MGTDAARTGRDIKDDKVPVGSFFLPDHESPGRASSESSNIVCIVSRAEGMCKRPRTSIQRHTNVSTLGRGKKTFCRSLASSKAAGFSLGRGSRRTHG